MTGAAGAIGKAVAPALGQRGHAVRGFDRLPMPHLADAVVGNLTERAAVARAMAGVDVVLHLGAYRNDAGFMDVLLEPNVIGLHHVCDAAQEAGVQRLVLASTIQVVAGFGRYDAPIRVTDGPRPTNHYALTKVWAELMGDMMARCHAMSVINVRVGWFARNQTIARRIQRSERGPNIYLSHSDAQRFFIRCVESPMPAAGECVTVFATSQPQTAPPVDLAPARDVLGYEPHDIWPQGLPFTLDAESL